MFYVWPTAVRVSVCSCVTFNYVLRFVWLNTEHWTTNTTLNSNCYNSPPRYYNIIPVSVSHWQLSTGSVGGSCLFGSNSMVTWPLGANKSISSFHQNEYLLQNTTKRGHFSRAERYTAPCNIFCGISCVRGGAGARARGRARQSAHVPSRTHSGHSLGAQCCQPVLTE